MIKKFQSGGDLIDEETLFSDDEPAVAAPGGAPTVAGEYQASTEDPSLLDDDPDAPEIPEPSREDAQEPITPENVSEVDLTGIDLFLADYGVRGGIIKFEGGESAHFSELTPEGQKEVLSSLVLNSVPTIEDKFDLDDSEVTFLNALRESGSSSVEEFVNSIVDHRLNSVIAEQTASTINFKELSDDDIFLMNLREAKPDFSDGDLVDELEKAKALSSYDRLTDSMRENYIARQEALLSTIEEGRNGAYLEQLEGQRHDIASTVADMDSIAGSPLTDEVKEFLLHDIMELNEHNDPILMEKIFADPETMFKANWFLTYGEDHIKNLNEYWKKEVSKAEKRGYSRSINGMPEHPTIIGADRGINRKNENQNPDGPITFGKEVDELEMFE